MLSDPRLLLLETSGRAGLVGLALGPNLLEARQLDETRRNARDLAPTVAELLGTQNWTARDLDGIVVGLGPGSYTGLRVGVMSAKTLAYASASALLGIGTFATLAYRAPTSFPAVEVIADAQKDRLYRQLYQRNGDLWIPAGELTIVTVADWLTLRDPEAVVLGPGVPKVRAHLPADRIAPPETWQPSAMSLLELGLRRFHGDERDDPFTLEPIYLRASSAEEQWAARAAPSETAPDLSA